MNDAQKKQIKHLREEGLSYGKIAQQMNISQNTIKTYCKRHGLGESIKPTPHNTIRIGKCEWCGEQMTYIEGRKHKRFCSDKCRYTWWNANPKKVKRRQYYVFKCKCCGKQFKAYGNRSRRYCCHQCYITDRFGR